MKTAVRSTKGKLLTKEEMTNEKIVPKWVVQEYKNFREVVTNKTFPCYFGMSAEKMGNFGIPILVMIIGTIYQIL